MEGELKFKVVVVLLFFVLVVYLGGKEGLASIVVIIIISLIYFLITGQSPSEIYKCPHCRHILSFLPRSDSTFRCPYCNKSVRR